MKYLLLIFSLGLITGCSHCEDCYSGEDLCHAPFTDNISCQLAQSCFSADPSNAVVNDYIFYNCVNNTEEVSP